MANRYMSSVWMSAVIVQALVLTVQAAKLPNIYWNMSNPIFRIDNTDHIIDVNRDVLIDPRQTDQVDIVCPKHETSVPEEATERYVVYNVTREEYETCSIRNIRQKKIIAQCNKPYSNLYFTITFRSFTPQPGAMEYKPGHDYYFIAVSENYPNGENFCMTRNMRVQFKVCCKNDRPHFMHRTTKAPAITSTTSTTPVPNPAENDIKSGGDFYPFYRYPPSTERPIHRIPQQSSTIAYWPHPPSAKPEQPERPASSEWPYSSHRPPYRPREHPKKHHNRHHDKPVSDDNSVFRTSYKPWFGNKEGLINSSWNLLPPTALIWSVLIAPIMLRWW